MKLNFDEAMQRLNEERVVHRHEVYAEALKRGVWVAEWHIPGCLNEAMTYCTTKGDAVQAALDFASNEVDHFPRGMKKALQREGSFQHHSEMYGNVVTAIHQGALGDYIGN